MACGLSLVFALFAQTQDSSPQLKTAQHHPMQYYLSLPRGWTAEKRWPVVMVIESANRQFENTAAEFAKARNDLPFIIAAPLVVTNGGPGFRSVPTYHYSTEAWSEVDRAGPFRFDFEGITAVMTDVKSLYAGEDRYFLTGWEAGGHTVWAMIFQHPEQLRAAAPVSTNYLGRWTDASGFSSSPARADLPVKIFQVEHLPGPFLGQMVEAQKTAEAHGYRNISVSVVAGKPHGPLAGEVLQWFASLR